MPAQLENRSEAAIQKSILLRFGTDPRCRIWRSNSGKLPDPKTGRWIQFNFKGHPDIAGFTQSGKAMFIEVKAEGGHLSPEQAAFRDLCNEWGVIWILAQGCSAEQSVEDALYRDAHTLLTGH